MSYLFVAANTDDDLSHAAAVVSGPPFVFGAWIKLASTPAEEKPVIAVRTSGSGNHRYTMSITASSTVQGTARTTAGSSAVTTDTVPNDGNWYLVMYEEVSSTERYASFMGVRGAVNTTSRVPSGMNLTEIGGSNVGSPRFFDGHIALPFIGALTLDDTQRAALAAATPASVITPTAHWLLAANTSPQPSTVGSFDMVVDSATWSSDEPTFSAGGIALLPMFFQRTNPLLRL